MFKEKVYARTDGRTRENRSWHKLAGLVELITHFRIASIIDTEKRGRCAILSKGVRDNCIQTSVPLRRKLHVPYSPAILENILSLFSHGSCEAVFES